MTTAGMLTGGAPETQKGPADEGRLIDRILAGDEEAFAELVATYSPRLFRLIHGIVGDWQRSEDACQETFVNVHLKLHKFERRSLLSTWLYRMAVNSALKTRSKAAARRELTLETVDGAAGGDDGTLSFESEEVFKKLLRPLPRHLRAVVLLKEEEGLSYQEIADVLGCSLGAVEQRLHRAFCLLRDIWKDHREEFGFGR